MKYEIVLGRGRVTSSEMKLRNSTDPAPFKHFEYGFGPSERKAFAVMLDELSQKYPEKFIDESEFQELAGRIEHFGKANIHDEFCQANAECRDGGDCNLAYFVGIKFTLRDSR